MVKSSRSHQEEEEVYDDKEFISANYGSSQNAMVDATISGQQPATHRSKHSATEQRRRSKINERFQILRDIIPQNDQKRDKASFLLEVIQYIQFLQEKLKMYEGSYQTWNHEPAKLIPWKNYQGSAEPFVDHSQVGVNGTDEENNVVSPTILTNTQNLVESDLSIGVYGVVDPAHGPAAKTTPLSVPLQPNMFASCVRGVLPTHQSQRYVNDAEHMSSQVHCQLNQGKQCATECSIPSNALHEQDFMADHRENSISGAYSQGVLHTLTRALQSSGIDMSQASISVQIDVAKQANDGNCAAYGHQDYENHSPRNEAPAPTMVGNFCEDSEQAYKRVRTDKR